VFAEEVVWYHDKAKYRNPLRIDLGSGHKETRLHEESQSRPEKRTIADHALWTMRSWKIYHFHDTSASAKVKLTGDIDDNQLLRADASNLAAFLYWMQEQQPAHYDRIVKHIRLVAPFFDNLVLRPSRRNPDKIRLEWKERNSDTYFNANMLSDGTLRFMCLATLLLQPDLPSIILLDEPELGLHPYAINQLAGLLRSASTQTQVIVSTQSVPLINQFEPENLIVVDRKDEQSVFRRLIAEEVDEWMTEYSLGELWEKNVLGGRPQAWEPRK
jgi:predicted ATPase